jgi:hypothetical protein
MFNWKPISEYSLEQQYVLVRMNIKIEKKLEIAQEDE